MEVLSKKDLKSNINSIQIQNSIQNGLFAHKLRKLLKYCIKQKTCKSLRGTKITLVFESS